MTEKRIAYIWDRLTVYEAAEVDAIVRNHGGLRLVYVDSAGGGTIDPTGWVTAEEAPEDELKLLSWVIVGMLVQAGYQRLFAREQYTDRCPTCGELRYR